MSDTEEKPGSGSGSDAPSWQRDAAQSGAEHKLPDQLQVARRFLQEAHVKASSREKKTEFLKAKGLHASDIEKLLEEEAEQSTNAAAAAAAASSSSSSSQKEQERSPESETAQPSHPPNQYPPQQQQQQQQANVISDRPPIVTYPEFLVKPERPPPLVTKNGIISTLYAFAGLSTMLYGTSKYFIGPMVDTLTDARTELHSVAAQKLDTLVAQLEKTVSVVPPAAVVASARPPDHHDSEDEDPTEMFHRDVGTQTALLIDHHASPSPAAKTNGVGEGRGVEEEKEEEETASQRQADRLTSLTKTLSLLKDQFRAQSEGFEDIKTLLDVFRDDLDGMTYSGGLPDFLGSGYDVYGTSKKEPEDEIRKVRDNIRRVKGLLLSTRNFPVSTR
ncbi:hypothetical protein E4U43_005547 [Claviceps pusilla]|uniref:Peroxisomal membrane protein PEX14 n=1 Tax=Claviceps pusilla TaxID=123648 RepID=A0A9P7NGT8_9HYPO|nr:hypothetical protein E4U43_005547 [Claviceps pusilla]